MMPIAVACSGVTSKPVGRRRRCRGGGEELLLGSCRRELFLLSWEFASQVMKRRDKQLELRATRRVPIGIPHAAS